jgi:DNA modification methylase
MTIYLLNSDARNIPMADQSVQCVVTSPPYWGLRDYGVTGQIGLERTPQEYVASIVAVMREVWRVLRDDGVLWLNIGDSYAGGGNYRGINDNTLSAKQRSNRGSHGLPQSVGNIVPNGLKPKDLVGIPWRVAFALQEAGWYLRSDIIWHKPNPMPESVTDRPTKAHEYIFLLAKSERYYYDAEAIKEENTGIVGNARSFRGGGAYTKGRSFNNNTAVDRETHGNDFVLNGRNRRSVWTVATSPYNGTTDDYSSRADYVGVDGKPYIASPNCPVHGHLANARTSYTAEYDGQQDQIENDNLDSDIDRELAPSFLKSATTSRNESDEQTDNVRMQNPESIDDCKNEVDHLEYTLPVQTSPRTNRTLEYDEPLDHTSDLQAREYSSSAKQHNKRKSKTARAQSSLQHDTASVQSLFGTPRIEQLDAQTDLVDHIDESKNEGRDSNDIQDSQTVFRTADSIQQKVLSVSLLTSNGNCTCKRCKTQVDHFATFPPALVEPMVLAGTSAKGECPHCGKAWARVVERSGGNWEDRKASGAPMRYGMNNNKGEIITNYGGSESTTVGWIPQCDCTAAEPVPQIVLDPFSGSGTVGRVSAKHGRRFVGLELNPSYIELAQQRTSKVQTAMQI